VVATRWKDGAGLAVVLMPGPQGLIHGDLQLRLWLLPRFPFFSLLSIKLEYLVLAALFLLVAMVAGGGMKLKDSVLLGKSKMLLRAESINGGESAPRLSLANKATP
jgi:hypothetical protein